MVKTKLTEEQKDYIFNNFGILKISEISENLNIKERSVQYFCTKNNLKLTSEQRKIILKQRTKKYSLNDLFFNSFTNESSYWAGFIAADGCVIENRLKIKLKSTDEEHLVNFLKNIDSNHTILHETGKRQETITYASTILITSDQVVKDLFNIYNITPNKSLILNPPNITNNLYIDCFIKGLFDGDGTIYWKDNRYYCVRFYGTLAINEWVKLRIDKLFEKNSGSVFKKNNIFCYELSKSASEFFIQYYKKINTPFLERKWNKGEIDIEEIN